MELADRPRLKTPQKRNLFKARFSRILSEHGFQFRCGCFIRFHRDQLVLQLRMDLDRSGAAEICFGGMPLCIADINPDQRFGESMLDFGRIHPLPENIYLLPFEEQLEVQAELFERYLLEPFTEIDSIASLLDYQERTLEDRLGMMPADWAAWECICLRDYEKALRYAQAWTKLAQDEHEDYCASSRAKIMAEDLTGHDRTIRLRDHRYNCKRRMHSVYEAQRLAHLLDIGAYPLLQENIRRNIEAANAAFDNI